MKKWVATFLIFIFAVMINGCNNSNSDPGAVAKEFYAAVINKDSDKIFKIMYISDDKTTNSLMSKSYMDSKLNMIINNAASRMEARGGVKSVDVTDVEIKDGNAIATMNVVYNNGTKQTDYVVLHKTDDGWKVVLR
ncbi:DUF4878 domain-containing protein [Orbaceae bacterium ESL0721]|nr:DUF4878 domain-containing protein [Orbaceae bacterium ESL0721]